MSWLIVMPLKMAAMSGEQFEFPLEVLAKTGAGFKGLLKSAIRNVNPVFI